MLGSYMMQTLHQWPHLEQIETRLSELLQTQACENETLIKAARYTLFASAKRLRPQMLLAIAGISGLDIACALEFIHTYSLIHDDLPCMDNDDYRRGQPSLHKAFSEDIAVLTGDFLLTYAFEVIANSAFSAPSKVSLIQTFAKGIGSIGLVGGQVLDMAAKEADIDWEMYQILANKKTSSLFTVALTCGAIIAGLSVEEKKILASFGDLFGLIYQIADDLEDLNPPSAVAILGKEKVIEVQENLVSQALELLSLLPNQYPLLEEILPTLLPRSSND